MNERDLQLAIYRYRRAIKPWPILVCNVYHWDWESDALYVSTDGFLTEYECKCTLSDFRADAGKQRKHLMMANGNGPKQFYYVCPDNLIPVSDVPDHAGLLYAIPAQWHYGDEPEGQLTLKVVKKAPVRKVEPCPPHRINQLCLKAVDRYWSMRLEMVRREQRLARKANP